MLIVCVRPKAAALSAGLGRLFVAQIKIALATVVELPHRSRGISKQRPQTRKKLNEWNENPPCAYADELVFKVVLILAVVRSDEADWTIAAGACKPFRFDSIMS